MVSIGDPVGWLVNKAYPVRNFGYPDVPTLETCISTVLADLQQESGRVVVLERQPNPYQSSLSSEVVECRLEDGQTLQLFLKYDSLEKLTHQGHWHSVELEAQVYRGILQHLPVSVPKFYGTWINGDTGQMCLVMQWINGLRADKASLPGMLAAARWLGRFHTLAEEWAGRSSVHFLQAYDTQYYRRWAEGTLRNANELLMQYSWLPSLCERFSEAVSVMITGPMVLVHGEYYPSNILVQDATAYPVDWQSAAIARGELDLASLTEGLENSELARQCEQEYERTRWPGGAPKEYHAALSLARVYWPLRWLGSDAESALSPARRWYFDQAISQGRIAGLL